MALILDTGPLYATLDRDDAAYRSCRKLVEEATEQLVIPALVLVEVDYWIHQRLHPGILVAQHFSILRPRHVAGLQLLPDTI